MGQKVNPNSLRIGINRDWSSHWYADKKQFASCVDEDHHSQRFSRNSESAKR